MENTSPIFAGRRMVVAAVGRAYTDIIADISPKFLSRHAEILPNRGIPVEREKLIRMLEEIEEPTLRAWGCTANTAATIAALGGRAGYFGKLCNDEHGIFFCRTFRRAALNCCVTHLRQMASIHHCAWC
jgi:sugar/nucleoside kinase (ribokinase family)